MANWVKKPRGDYEVEIIRDQRVTENPKQLHYRVKWKWKNWSDASNEWFLAEELEKTAPLIVSDWKKQREMDSDLEESSESEDNEENAEEASNPEENQDDVDEASGTEDNHQDDDDCFDQMPVRKVSEVEMESVIDQLGAAVDKDCKQMLEVASIGNELLDPDTFDEKCKMKVLKDHAGLFNKKLSIQRRPAVEKREEQAEGFKILAGVMKDVLQLDTEITQANLHLCLPEIHEKVQEVNEKLSQLKKFETILEQMNKI